MKKISLKLQITIFNTLLIASLVFIVFLYLLSISESMVESASIEQLEDVIYDNSKEIQYYDGYINVEDVDLLKNNVTTLLYGVDGSLLYGSAGKLPVLDAPTTDGAIVSATLEGNTYYIYDSYLEFEEGVGVWLRGVIPLEDTDYAITNIFKVALATFPFLILIAAIGCYFITKQSFQPVEQMVQTAHNITNDNDLSLRIPVTSGGDEIHQLGNTFNEMLDKIEDSFQMERQFSSDVSHELRTPTAVILAQCEYALSSDSTQEEQIEALEVVQRQSMKIQQMITNLLNLTRLDRGLEQSILETCNLSELIELVCEEQKLLAPAGMMLQTNITPNLMMEVDYAMMIRMMSNLIENGFRYGRKNGNLEVILTDEVTHLRLEVADNGIGIEECNQSKIFQRFYQVDSARTNDGTGSMGLGLSMVSQIVKIHKGSISVESELGVGTTFIINFPKE
ncbi:MAG: ATP-binding protein [Eubacteriales bacterium]